jgi:hypothetical protein
MMHVRRVSIFLTVVTLTVGMTGCFTPFRMQYQVRISSTEGGSVTTPGEGVFTYWEGTAVSLVAEAEEGCHFANWTGNVSTVSNVTSATTSITMNCDYSITANFQRMSYHLGTSVWHQRQGSGCRSHDKYFW